MDESIVNSKNDVEYLATAGNRCIQCGKTLTTFSNLCKHVRSIHKAADIKIDYRKCSLCPICDVELISKKLYEEHLLSEHDTKLEKINLKFESVEAFSEWKNTTERKNRCMYVKRTGSKKNGSLRVEYLYCHRSGDYKRSGTGKRKLKWKGSNKIQKTCPSRMKVIFKDDKVNIEYVKTHLGHSFDIERMKINEEEKKSIAEKLASGMTNSQVLASIQKPPSGKMEPIHTLTYKDIQNIRRDLKIPTIKKQRTEKAVKRSKGKKAVVLENNHNEITLNINSDTNNTSEVVYVYSIIEPEEAEVIYSSHENNLIQNDSFGNDPLENKSCQITFLHNQEELNNLFQSIME